MEDLNIYKPSPSFPAKKGAAFQFKPGLKTDSNDMQTACIFVEAVPQSEPRGKERRSKQSGFVWVVKDGDNYIPHPKKIVFCMDLVDLSAIDAFFLEADRQVVAYYLSQDLRTFGISLGKAMASLGMAVDSILEKLDINEPETSRSLDDLRAFVDSRIELPENSVRLTHQHTPPGYDKEITKGFEISYPYGYDKDVQIKLTSNNGAGHNVIQTFLKPNEVAALRTLIQGTMRRYFFSPKRRSKNAKS